MSTDTNCGDVDCDSQLAGEGWECPLWPICCELLGIVEDEYNDDRERDDLPRWKDIIDQARKILEGPNDETD